MFVKDAKEATKTLKIMSENAAALKLESGWQWRELGSQYIPLAAALPLD